MHPKYRTPAVALAALALTAAVAVVPAALPGPAAAQSGCTFQLGFATLRGLIGPATVGTCLADEAFNAANGNAEQRTTGGLLVWRKADNWTAFTNGHETWINGPNGLARRLNAQRFAWEAASEPGASRENPVPRGMAADGGDGWYIGVVDYVPDAAAQIRAANRLNDPPLPGRRFVMARIAATRTDPTPAAFYEPLNVVGPANVAYGPLSGPEVSCGVVPDPLPQTEVFPGGTIVGNVCWQVPAAEADALVLYHTALPEGGGRSVRVYHALR